MTAGQRRATLVDLIGRACSGSELNQLADKITAREDLTRDNIATLQGVFARRCSELAAAPPRRRSS